MSDRLPIEDLYFYADIVLTLVGGGRPPTTNVDFETWFTHQNVNKYGIDPDYCPGATADDRLTELQNEPYEMGHFRNYGHDPDPVDFDYKIYIINNSGYSSSNIGVIGDFIIKTPPLGGAYDTVSLDIKSQGVDSPIERNYEDIVVGTYYIDFSDLNIQYQEFGTWHSEPPVKYEWWFSGLSSPTEGTETDDFEILGDGVTTEPNTIVMRLTFRTTTTTTTAPTTTTTTVAPTTTTTTTTTVAPTTTTTTTTTVAPTTTTTTTTVTTPEPDDNVNVEIVVVDERQAAIPLGEYKITGSVTFKKDCDNIETYTDTINHNLDTLNYYTYDRFLAINTEFCLNFYDLEIRKQSNNELLDVNSTIWSWDVKPFGDDDDGSGTETSIFEIGNNENIEIVLTLSVFID